MGTESKVLDASSLLGITASVGLMLPALVVPDLSFLAVPAFAVFVPSLLYGTR